MSVDHRPEHPSLPPHQRHRQPRRPGIPFDDEARWIAITPGNARRVTIIVLAAVVLLSVATWAFQAMSSFLFLLLLAWLVSIAMEPVVLWLSGRGMKRGLATGLTMLGMLLLFVGLVELFGQVFISQLSQLGTQLPGAVTSAINWVNSTFDTNFDLEQIQSALSLTPDKLGELAASTAAASSASSARSSPSSSTP